MSIVPALARVQVGQQPAQDAGSDWLTSWGLVAPLTTKGVTMRCHHIPRHSPLNCGPTTTLGTMNRKIPSPRMPQPTVRQDRL